MAGTSRRQFLNQGAGGTAGMTSWLALGKAPALAQKRELTFLSWNHFVPASDDELRRQAEVFGKQAGVTVRVDTIAHLQLPAKRAAEAQAQSGHDLVFVADADPFLFESQLVDLADVIDDLGKRYGGWYAFAEEAANTKSGWRAVPWFWVSFPATYNMVHFKNAGLETPKTWAELLHHGKILKKQGNPVGIAISHCADANTTFWSVLWCYGGKVLEADGKTPAINSDKTAQVVEWYKELFKDAMEPEVLSWDDASNNRFILSGKCSWIHNPKFVMLPKEAEFAHPRGWPAKPNAAVRLIDVNYVLPDMVAKAIAGMPIKRAIAWAEDQIKLAVQGRLETKGKV